MQVERSFEERVRDLGRTEAQARPGGEVSTRSTPTSVLFFSEHTVTRLKRPLPPSCLTVEGRREVCEEIVRQDRRFFPFGSIGIRSVAPAEDGRLAIDAVGEPVDWVVETARMPEECALGTLLAQGAFGEDETEAFVRALARYHHRARTGPTINRHALPERLRGDFRRALARVIADREVRAGTGLDRNALEDVGRRVESFLRARSALLTRRVGEWRIREGHGDLSARNVWLTPAGVRVLGCAQSERALRCGDVAADLAVLTAELARDGHGAVAARLRRTWARHEGDAAARELVRFYELHGSVVRAGLLASRARAAGVRERGAFAGILERARAFLRRVAVLDDVRAR